MRRRLTFAFAALVCGCGSSEVALSPRDAGAGEIPDATLNDAPVDTGTDAPTDAPRALPKGARVLALDINSADDNDYLKALAIAQSAGIQATNVSLNWDDIEVPPDPDAGADAGPVTYYNPYLHIANLVFPPKHVQVSLAIRPVDTTRKRVPADLAGKRFDDPAVIDRFNRLQDYVFGELPDVSLVTYVIGNEVDVFFGSDAAAFGEYKTFFDATSAYARTKHAGLKVGVTASLGGYLGAAQASLAALNASSDVIAVTYYPVRSDFTIRPTASVQLDIEALLAMVPGKPIHFREAGFPSGAAVKGTEADQAAFVRETFRVWDLHGDRIPLVTFFTLTEYPQATVDRLATYYGVADPKFKEYLRTLGLRSYADGGADKPAFQALTVEAHARGW